MLISDTNLPLRTRNILIAGGIKTVNALSYLSDDQLLRVPMLGKKTIRDIREWLDAHAPEAEQNRKLMEWIEQAKSIFPGWHIDIRPPKLK